MLAGAILIEKQVRAIAISLGLVDAHVNQLAVSRRVGAVSIR